MLVIKLKTPGTRHIRNIKKHSKKKITREAETKALCKQGHLLSVFFSGASSDGSRFHPPPKSACAQQL
jgi:hypothetical protein